jgi:acetyl-CoA carboxylase biotin carboxylase subunit
MFKKILIANRGEIALRIQRACREIGVKSVVVYSEADRDAKYVKLADEAVCIGPAPSTQSYLNMPAIIATAEVTDAEAIHPGYGFLSENADFAERVEKSGFTFIGPTSESIRIMGDKVSAKQAMIKSGVPCVPGSEGALPDDPKEAIKAARAIGYPVIIKAAGGGGGRGIRIVHDHAMLHSQYKTAAREAAVAFDDARIYVERFITPARHVEVQVLGDGERTIHLHERECSLQRRRQKVVEETPAPRLAEATRVGLYEAAIALCNEIGYRSAGTVEFLVDASSGEFFFIEMNTRIQVEHPVTEAITGIDLIAEQLRIAAGEPLQLRQEDVAPRGCAIELRINAEDPANNFMPSPGQLHRVVLPAGPWVRVDTWMEPGGEVPPFYDSLLGKVIVWGPDRGSALARARRALGELEVESVKTTKPLLAELLRQDWFNAGEFDTGTLERWLEATTNGSAGA